MADISQSPCVLIDNTIGPYAQHCRGGFDFTLFFEEIFFVVAPVVALILVAPNRIWYLFGKERKVGTSVLQYLKFLAFSLLLAANIFLLVLWSKPSAIKTEATLPATGLAVAASAFALILSYAEHVRSVQPSFILDVYLFFTLIFDAARCRTLWLMQYNRNIAYVTTAMAGIKVLCLLLESIEKQSFLKPQYKEYPPEATSSIFNRSTFWWLNRLFRAGFGKLLFMDDLFQLDKHLKSEHLEKSVQDAWAKVPKERSPHAFFFTVLSTLKWPLIAVIPPRLALTAFNFTQPFLIERAIKLSTEPVTKETTQYGYGLIGAYVVAYTGIAVCMGQYQHLTYRAITMVRGAVVSMLYKKTGNISMTAVDPAASITLMSADIERIVMGMQMMHEIWSNLLEIAIAIFLLEKQLGVACAVPVGVAVLSIMLSVVVTGFVMSRQAMWLEAIEKRIAATTAMLGSMKGVKMSGLTNTMKKILQKLRFDELEISKKFRKLLIWNMAFSFMTPVVAPILTFAVFSVLAKNKGDGATLDTARIFTSLSLFSLLTEPLTSLIMAVATFMGSVGCFARIQEFLDSESRQDPRTKPGDIPNDSNGTLSEKWYLDGEKQIFSDRSTLDLLSEKNFRSSHSSLSAVGPNAITIRDGAFGWDKEKDPILNGINMDVPKAKFTMVLGPVGCGKSTLLKAILGEVPVSQGTVQMSSLRIAYCDQTPWHMNVSIRDSIVGIGEFDQQWYDTVIHACALEQDLRQMAKGDKTTIGSKGIALSGGQSQRIALARAIYALKEIIIIDDALSGLDQETENHVFHNLLGRNGLLRRHRATVLIASSSAKRLPYADHVVALDAEGKIAEQGTFDDLNCNGGYVSSFTLAPANWDYTPERKDVVEELIAAKSALAAQENYVNPVLDEQTLDAEANRRTGDKTVYLYYVRSVGWTATIIFVVAISAFIFCQSFPNVWVKWWATANAEQPNQRLGYYLGVYGALGAAALLALVVSCWQMIITMVPKSGEFFHDILLKTVMNSPLSFFASTDTGVTLNRFSQDLQLIDMELPVAALNTFATFVLCLAQMALIGVASKYAAICFPIVVGTLWAIQKFYLRTSRQLRFMDLEAKSPLYSQFVECINGLATIRAFGWQKDLEKKNRELLDRSQRPFYLLFSVQRWLTFVLDLVVMAIAVLLIVLVVKLRGTISAGYVGIALYNVITFSMSVKLLVTFWTTMETHIGAIARIKIFTTDAASEHKDDENRLPPPEWPKMGAIELHRVTAGYKSNEPIIKNVSLSINAGEKVGVCGRTGSGKSSLILTIFRMIEMSYGSIIIDGIDLSTIPREEIRSRIVGVPQDAYLLNGSVRLNADPSEIVSDEEIVDALKVVQLWEIVEEKGGLDINIEEVHLTHGQKQLFCLARAMLRPSSILILDEATSSVDSKTDELMQRIIREKFSTHTIIAIAHKLDTILDFDKIALLDAGELVEFDSPSALMSQEDSLFAKLYRATKIEAPITISDSSTNSASGESVSGIEGVGIGMAMSERSFEGFGASGRSSTFDGR